MQMHTEQAPSPTMEELEMVFCKKTGPIADLGMVRQAFWAAPVCTTGLFWFPYPVFLVFVPSQIT